MRVSMALAAVALVAALAGCKGRFETKDDDGTGNVSIAMGGNTSGGVSIDTPVFKANVKLPALNFGGEHMDLDGIKLAPGTRVTGVNVDAHDEKGSDGDEGIVRIAFTSPDAPAKLVDYYTAAARDNGFAASAPPAGAAFHATKREEGKPKAFDLAVSPAAGGSSGTITLTGS